MVRRGRRCLLHHKKGVEEEVRWMCRQGGLELLRTWRQRKAKERTSKRYGYRHNGNGVDCCRIILY